MGSDSEDSVPTGTGDPAITEQKELEKESGGNALPAVLLLVALLGGGGFILFKKMKSKQKQQAQERPDPDADYVNDEEDEKLDFPDNIGDFGDDEPMDESAFVVETAGIRKKRHPTGRISALLHIFSHFSQNMLYYGYL